MTLMHVPRKTYLNKTLRSYLIQADSTYTVEMCLHQKSSSRRTPRLLYIEDNPSDARLLQAALQEYDSKIDLTWLPDGEKGLAFLNGAHPYTDAQRPDLIILDLNLPRMPGEQILFQIKNNPKLKSMPVVIFSSAADAVICSPVYHENANACMRKPSDWDDYCQLVKTTCDFWFKSACLLER